MPTQLTCAAFVDPTNTFHLNDGVQGSNLINTNTPVFTLAADGPLAQYTVKVDDSILPGVYRNYTSSTTCVKVPTGMLTDGAHTISAVEIAPNPQQVAPYNFVTDTTPPTPPTITSATFSSGFVRMSGTGLALFTVKSCEGFLCNGGAAVGTTGLWSIATSKPSGTHQLYVVQMDKAGNVSSPSNIVTVVVP